MAIKHKHHIIPKHMGGDDCVSNLIELSVPEHALAHKKLWEIHGLKLTQNRYIISKMINANNCDWKII